MQNLYQDGITSVAADLADSPAALAVTLASLVHNFGMNTLGSISSWMTLVANEVDDLAVSKHSTHVSFSCLSLRDILRSIGKALTTVVCRPKR